MNRSVKENLDVKMPRRNYSLFVLLAVAAIRRVSSGTSVSRHASVLMQGQ